MKRFNQFTIAVVKNIILGDIWDSKALCLTLSGKSYGMFLRRFQAKQFKFCFIFRQEKFVLKF